MLTETKRSVASGQWPVVSENAPLQSRFSNLFRTTTVREWSPGIYAGRD